MSSTNNVPTSEVQTPAVDRAESDNTPIGADSEAAFARQLHQIVKGLSVPRAAIFWCDFLCSLSIGYAALWFYLTMPTFSPVQVVCLFVAGFVLYRVLIFIHELTHLPRTPGFTAFRIAWNVLAGIPLMTPSFLYAEHKSHHLNHSYGTSGDAEYVAVGRGPVGWVFFFVAQGLLMPVLAVLRFGVVAPLSLLHPKLRRFVWERASGLTQNNLDYRRPLAEGRDKLVWGLQEAGCFLVWLAGLTLLLRGIVPWTVLPKLWILFAFTMTVSYLRALATHWYWNEGAQMTYVEQMLDSTTIPGHPLLTELWAPLGMRYHALHHLMPSIPYHSLGVAHRRLMRDLPADSPYRKTLRPSLWSGLRELYQGAKAEDRRRRSQAA